MQETKGEVERLQQRVREAKEEGEMIRRDCQQRLKEMQVSIQVNERGDEDRLRLSKACPIKRTCGVKAWDHLKNKIYPSTASPSFLNEVILPAARRRIRWAATSNVQ